MNQKAGRIRVGGKDHEATFEPAGNTTAAAIDAAYEEKYKGSSAVPIMQGVSPLVRSAAALGNRTPDLRITSVFGRAHG